MALIKTVSFEEADGVVKKAYESFIDKLGVIPKPLEMMSASPFMFEAQLKRLDYYASHPTLSFALLTHIRYFAAQQLKYSFCTDFNTIILKKLGLTQEDIQQMTDDPSKCLLEENETAMLMFVVQSLKNPGSAAASDIDALKKLGWNDRDMMDALAHGVVMIDYAIMMQVFQIDQSCMV